jgi:hypothetical protein
VIVFPELNLTGYELDAVVAPDNGALARIAEVKAEVKSVPLDSAPVAGESGKVHISVAA